MNRETSDSTPLNPASVNRTPLNVTPSSRGGFDISVPSPGALGQPHPGASVPRIISRDNSVDLQKEVQQLKHQLHELREQVEALRKK